MEHVYEGTMSVHTQKNEDLLNFKSCFKQFYGVFGTKCSAVETWVVTEGAIPEPTLGKVFACSKQTGCAH